MSILNKTKEAASTMPPSQKMLAAAVALAIFTGAGAGLYLTNAESNQGFVPLVSSAESTEIPAIMEQFDASKISYRVTAAGDLLVADADVTAARTLMAKNGQLFYGQSGYDLLNKEQSIFINQTQQKLLKTQILEENLQNTLSEIKGVKSVRVHLSLSETSEFMRDTNKSSASIMLEVMPGVRLSEDQIQGIANLTSSSIPFLSPEDVTITDQFARQLSAGEESSLSMSTSQIKYKQRFENTMRSNIMQVVAPLVGMDNMRVSVVADINFDKIQNTKEEYINDPQAVLSEQLEYNYDKSYNGGQGVPGALSNQPPGHTSFSEGDKKSSTSRDPSISHERVTRNYNIGRSVTNTNYGGTEVEKIDVVVLVDKTTLEAGFKFEEAPAPLPEAPVAPEELVKPVEPEFAAETKPEDMDEEEKAEFDAYKQELSKYEAALPGYEAEMEKYRPLKAAYDVEAKRIQEEHSAKMAADKTVALDAYIANKIANIERLSQRAAGIDQDRGDGIAVIADSFMIQQPAVVVEKAPESEKADMTDYAMMAVNVVAALALLLFGFVFMRRKGQKKDKVDMSQEQEENVQQILDSVGNDSFVEYSEDDIAKSMTKDQLEQDTLNADDVDLDALVDIAKDNLREKQTSALIVLNEWLADSSNLRESIVAEIKDDNAITRITKSHDAENSDESDEVAVNDTSDGFDIDQLLQENGTSDILLGHGDSEEYK